MQSVTVPVLAPESLQPVLGDERVTRLRQLGETVRQTLGSRMVLNVNSTAVGGGVAEMLHTLLGYARGSEIDMRWMTIDAPPEFFVLTKRLHHMLHGVETGIQLQGEERRLYEKVMSQQVPDLRATVRPGDVVILHDPQTAGLADALHAAGAQVAWRCHVGTAQRNGATERAWAFLRPYLHNASIVVSQSSYLPGWVDAGQSVEIPPSIDPLSPKNITLPPGFARAALQTAGLLSDGDTRALTFTRRDGSPGRIERAADVLQAGPPPPADAKLVVQVSRWDPLKDMAGVMRGFAEYVFPFDDSHLRAGRTQCHLGRGRP